MNVSSSLIDDSMSINYKNIMIVMSDACAMNVSRSIDDSRSINYKNSMFVNDTSRVDRMISQLGVSLIDNSRRVIYDCNMFIIQATDVSM
jgi:hypothetical protein